MQLCKEPAEGANKRKYNTDGNLHKTDRMTRVWLLVWQKCFDLKLRETACVFGKYYALLHVLKLKIVVFCNIGSFMSIKINI